VNFNGPQGLLIRKFNGDGLQGSVRPAQLILMKTFVGFAAPAIGKKLTCVFVFL
jgi:hypothetical protein